MTSVRLLADEFASIIGARETVLIDENDNLRQSLKRQRAETERQRAETDFWKRENDDTEVTTLETLATTTRDCQEKLAALKSQLATATRSCDEKLLAARMRADSQSQKIRTLDSAATDRNNAIAAARAQLEEYATAAAARDKELADVKAQLATTRMQLRDKLELDILAQRGDLEAEAERFRRSTRDPAADLREMGLVAREDDNEVMAEDL